jgi:hypothetical protein
MEGRNFPGSLRTALLKLVAIAAWVELFRISYWLGYGLQDPGFDFQRGKEIFFMSNMSEPDFGAHPSYY